MEKLMKTSKTVDTILKVVGILFKVAGIMITVCLGLFLVVELMDIEVDGMVTSFSLSGAEFLFKEPQPIYDNAFFMTEGIIACVIALFIVVLSAYLIKILRRIMVPMIAGNPFDGTVSKNLKKLGIAIIVNHIIITISNSVAVSMSCHMLLKNENIFNTIFTDVVERVTVTHSFGITEILVGVLVIMLSHVFHYGEQLQQQADETL